MEEESSSDSDVDEDGCARMGSAIGQRPMPPGTSIPRLNPAPPTQPQQPQPPPLPPAPDKVLVKKGYDPKQGE
jgi:splicing factor 3A subunit 1